ncbi:MAG: hypothetical protein JOZ39_05855 [Chloroflexi bacterium]|nr:hypothetical protein [Chloroflexota bacterium]
MPTWFEALPLLGLHPKITGIGRRQYRLAGFDQVISAGFAGACRPDIHPGQLVQGRTRTLDHLASAREKAQLADQGVDAVEMEDAWLREAAELAGLPFRAVRVIIDGVADHPFGLNTARHYPLAARELRRAVRNLFTGKQDASQE